jgi:nitroreductase
LAYLAIKVFFRPVLVEQRRLGNMDVLEAIQARHSVRDFDSKPVPKDIVLKIMDAATRSPSGGNGQPWEIFIAVGSALKNIRKVYQERAKDMPGGLPGPGAPGGPPPLPAFIQERMTIIRTERMKLLGLDPADPASARVFMEWGSRLFGAPVLVVICMDKALSSNLDIGMLIQTICLAAQNFGVDSLIAGSFVSQPDVLRKELDIPESLTIVIGVGLGYPNPENKINTYRSPRRPIQEVVRYKD